MGVLLLCQLQELFLPFRVLSNQVELLTAGDELLDLVVFLIVSDVVIQQIEDSQLHGLVHLIFLLSQRHQHDQVMLLEVSQLELVALNHPGVYLLVLVKLDHCLVVILRGSNKGPLRCQVKEAPSRHPESLSGL